MSRKKYKPVGMIKGGYGFLFCRRSRSIMVQNMVTFNKMYVTAPDTMINRFDLRLWADGFLAGNHQGWAAVI